MILSSQSGSLKEYLAEEIGVLVFGQIHPEIPKFNQYVLSDIGSVDEAAKNLFAILRDLDENQWSKAEINLVPNQGIGRAINDRIKRACVI